MLLMLCVHLLLYLYRSVGSAIGISILRWDRISPAETLSFAVTSSSAQLLCFVFHPTPLYASIVWEELCAAGTAIG
jgi:hypothetical protein